MSGILGTIGNGLTSIWNGVNEWGNPTSVPDGAGYGVQDLALSRQALLAQLGTNLLAASQAGLRPEARAQFLAQAGEAPMAASRILQAGAQQRTAATSQRLQAAQAQEAEAQMRQRQEFTDYLNRTYGGQGAQAASLAATAMPAAGGGRGATTGNYVQSVIAHESGGRTDARPTFADGSPRSSAFGPAQFIDSTWLSFASANPQFFQGMSREQILAARTNPELNAVATQWYGDLNARQLASAGIADTPQNRFLAHSFGAQGATALLRADPNAPAQQVLGDAVIRANPELAGRTAGEALRLRLGSFERRFGGGTQVASASPTVMSDAMPPGMNPQQQVLAQGGGMPAAAPAGRVQMTPEQLNAIRMSPNPQQAYTQFVLSQQRQASYQQLSTEQALRAGLISPQTAAASPHGMMWQRNVQNGRIEPITLPQRNLTVVQGVGAVDPSNPTNPDGTPRIVIPAASARDMTPAQFRQAFGRDPQPGEIGFRSADGTPEFREAPRTSEQQAASAGRETLVQSDRRVLQASDEAANTLRSRQVELATLQSFISQGRTVAGLNGVGRFEFPVVQEVRRLVAGLTGNEGLTNQQDIINQSIARLVPMLNAMPGALSDRDVQLLRDGVLNMRQSPESAALSIQLLSQATERGLRANELLRDYIANNNGTGRGAMEIDGQRVEFRSAREFVDRSLGAFITPARTAEDIIRVRPGSVVRLEGERPRNAPPTWPLVVVTPELIEDNRRRITQGSSR